MPRRVAFRTTLNHVQSTLLQSNLQNDSLVSPPAGALQARLSGLVKDLSGATRAPTQSKRPQQHHFARLAQRVVSKVRRSKQKRHDSQEREEDTKPDDGLRPLSSQDYIKVRLEPVLRRFEQLCPQLTFRAKLFRVLVIFGTSMGGLLAFLGYRLWISMVVALTSSLTNIGDYLMLDARLTATKHGVMKLRNLLLWWDSLTLVEKRLTENNEILVETCESVCDADMVWGSSAFTKRPGAAQSNQNDSNRTGVQQSS